MAFALNSTTERAYDRAKTLLLKEGALTNAECAELEGLLDDVSRTQFMALTRDPQHKSALRQYDKYAWRPAVPILITLILLFFFSVAMGFYLGQTR